MKRDIKDKKEEEVYPTPALGWGMYHCWYPGTLPVSGYTAGIRVRMSVSHVGVACGCRMSMLNAGVINMGLSGKMAHSHFNPD